MKRIILLTCLFLYSLSTFAQIPQWAIGLGSTGGDGANVTRVAPNGNVYVAGHYTGTMDLDPSTATTNITSYSSSQDMFLACYTSAGNFIWGFSLGREDYDDILGMAVDANNNVIISGFFRGQNVDFDPSSGTALLSCLGFTGGTGTDYGGDGFVAKYSSAGVYQWAFIIGTQYWIEVAEAVATDAAGNVYVGGQAKDLCDFDPSPAVANLNASVNGTGFLAKYSSAGAYQWAFNFGKPGIAGTDNTISDIKVDGNGDVCVAGFFQGPGPWDFDPSSTGTAMLTSSGGYDAFVGKYSSSGNYIFAFNIGGSGTDHFTGLTLDASNNIYVTGYTSINSIDFDPSSGTAISTLTGAGSENIMLAKYSSSGSYVWGKLIGSTSSDVGRKIVYSSNRIFCTGRFGGTVNFNPGSTPTANLVSSGNSDIYWASYDLSGVYQCSFNIGSSAADEGYSIAADATGNFYVAGQFSGVNTDFDPGTGTLPKTSSGGTDAFLVKYTPGGTGTTGVYFTGNRKCGPNDNAYLTYVDSLIPAGTSVTITYSDGTTSYTKSVQNKVPFQVVPNATTTTTYTLPGSSSNTCFGSVPGNSFTVKVVPLPVAFAGRDTNICSGATLQFTGSGGNTYQWYPTTGISNPASAVINPGITASITYYLIAIDTANCRDTAHVSITVLPSPVANAGSDKSVCENMPAVLNGSGGSSGITYLWYPSSGLSSTTIPAPTINSVSGLMIYNLVLTNANGCSDTDEVRISSYPTPIANAGLDTVGCKNDTVQLMGSGIGTYQWYGTNITILSPTLANAKAVIDMSGKAFLIVTNQYGCRDTDDVDIKLYVPEFEVEGTKNVCNGDTVQLSASGGLSYSWTPSTGLSATNIDNPIARPNADIIYSVTIFESYCKTSTTLPVAVYVREKPNVDATKSGDVDCSNGFVTLGANGADKYYWYPSATLSNAGTSMPIARPQSTTTYSVVGSNLYGCSDTVQIIVNFEGLPETALIAPTAFSPNEDGKNDCYKVRVRVPFKSFELAIYDRWGNKTFYTEDPNLCWDGTYNGIVGELGTYFYYLRIKTEACGEVFRKGDIHLIK